MKISTFIYIILFFSVISCTKKFEELNTDPTQFVTVSPEALMQTAVKRTGDMIGGAGLNSGINVNMWEIANFIEPGARYSANDQGVWQTSYVNILQNLVQLEKQYGGDTAFANRVQIARIWKAYVYSILVGYFGPIPVGEANNPESLNVINFESENAVYVKILAMLKEAGTAINTAGDKLTYDAVYGNGANQLVNWRKFANTLRLRIALRCRLNLPTEADAAIRELMGAETALINSEAETAKVPYEAVNNNENPYFKYYIKGAFTGNFPRMADQMFVYLRSYKDPRIDYFFDSVRLANRYRVTDTLTSTADDSLRVVNYPIPHYGLNKSNQVLPGWTATLAGQISPQGQTNQGGLNGNSAYSMLALNIINNPSRPIIILGFAEAQFLKAQAAILSLGGSQTAENYYNSGIDAGFAFWGVPLAMRNTYKAGDGIKFGTNGTGFWNYLHTNKADLPAGDINKIYFQTWLSYFPDQPFDAWCLQRQTRVLSLSPHTTPGLPTILFQDVPDRAVYPNTVNTQNPSGYQGALQLLGAAGFADETTNPYLRLKFEKPYVVPDYNAIPAVYDNSASRKWYGTTIQSVQAAAAASGFTVTITSTFK
ncbi:SusD/RagB family nutrient-binding outer membrane lipoprotein [Flavitalea sp.]|nr:SusD/RagB family nutrient-binding outer membrane lipoprotein [Flavitalea sp.]